MNEPIKLDALEVVEALARHVSPPEKPRLDPLDELVLTILSQSTTDANRDRAWAQLVAKFPGETRPVGWEDVHRSSESDLRETIRVAGLAKQKEGAIRGALDRLTSETGGPSLDHLADMEDQEAISYLTSFRGVGVKTAACVLCFSLRRPILPVDTHVLRVARRLGWVPPLATATKAHELLARRVPADERFRMHMLLITFGREVCKARSPLCEVCPLSARCPRVGVAR